MSNKSSKQPFNLGRTLRKYFVSAFVIFTFVAYALHEHSISSDDKASTLAPAPTAAPALTTAPLPAAPSFARPAPTIAPPPARPSPTIAPPRVQPTPTMTPPAVAAAQYKDGEYTGPSIDANWGLVQVKAIIQHGQIADVQFLQYPNDRRTSQRINSIVMPYLQTEAIQAQSANVDLISGATLTSEAFAESLQAALSTARN